MNEKNMQKKNSVGDFILGAAVGGLAVAAALMEQSAKGRVVVRETTTTVYRDRRPADVPGRNALRYKIIAFLESPGNAGELWSSFMCNTVADSMAKTFSASELEFMMSPANKVKIRQAVREAVSGQSMSIFFDSRFDIMMQSSMKARMRVMNPVVDSWDL
jgi:hypothetical protein